MTRTLASLWFGMALLVGGGLRADHEHPGAIIHPARIVGRVINHQGKPVGGAAVYIASSSGHAATGYQAEISHGEPYYYFTNGINYVQDGSLVYSQPSGRFVLQVEVVAYSIVHLGGFRLFIGAYRKDETGKRRDARGQGVEGRFDASRGHLVLYRHPGFLWDQWKYEPKFLKFRLPR